MQLVSTTAVSIGHDLRAQSTPDASLPSEIISSFKKITFLPSPQSFSRPHAILLHAPLAIAIVHHKRYRGSDALNSLLSDYVPPFVYPICKRIRLVALDKIHHGCASKHTWLVSIFDMRVQYVLTGFVWSRNRRGAAHTDTFESLTLLRIETIESTHHPVKHCAISGPSHGSKPGHTNL
jgi:hypothetical protein